MIRLVRAIAAGLLLGGCVTGSSVRAPMADDGSAASALSTPTRDSQFPDGTVIRRALVAPTGDAEAQAADLRLALLNSYGVINRNALNAYVNGMVREILEVAGMPASCCRVEILSDLSLQAEARPSGLITVSFGWLMQAEDDAELVGLFAHEIAHVLLGHYESDTYADAMTATNQVVSIAAGLSSKVRAATSLVRGVNCGSALTNDVFHPSWKRGQEREADQFATDVVAKLGLSVARGPKAMLERLGALEGAGTAKEATEVRPGEKLSGQLKDWAKSLSNAHDDSASRADFVSDYFEKVWSESPLRGRHSPRVGLIELRKDPEVAALLAAHQRVARVREQLAVANAGAALKATTDLKREKTDLLITHMAVCDGWATAQKVSEARACLTEGMRLSAGSWIPARALSNQLKRSGNGQQAIQTVEAGFDALGRPPVLLPEIAFLVHDLNKDVTEKYVRECMTAGSALLQACANNANPEERKRRSEEEGKRLANKITGKLFGK
ncbi:MAG TPA: M48 family metalloprotease [Aromatoleum sp.]|uniref:M48 family metalloprotease n=1 Tax=Aromatoleum sp. TaxID=2307007 RepID=UPI002B49A5BE|nr:M48 family metalloprotease [Aromatoleum sp.]HJV28011.1 M48 family metalloprotease [Aromatoleum sp.]